MGLIPIRVTPRSRKNSVEVRSGTIRVYVTAPPDDGRANEAVIKLLAKQVGIRASAISVQSGHTSRDKMLSIEHLELSQVLARLGQPPLI